MKPTILILTMTLLIVAGPLTSYSAENERAASAQLSQEKEKYERTMEERLSKLGKELDEMKTRASAMSEQARKDMKRYLADAERKQKAASRKLQEIRKESGEKWKKFVDEMDAAADDFAKAYERAKSHFKD
jgi:Skp family chaperone for outer membrane proteins